MIDLSKYIQDVEDIEFVEYIFTCLEEHYSIDLTYKNNIIHIDYGNPEIYVDGNKFDDYDEFLLEFILDGKPFISCISEVDFDE